MAYTVWYEPKDVIPGLGQMYIFIDGLHVVVGLADRIAEQLMDEGFVRRAWVEEV